MYGNLQKIMKNTVFLKYCMVGVINTGLYLGVLWFCIKHIKISNELSTFFALLISLVFQFTMNRKYTFKLRKTNITVKSKYLILTVINYVLSNFCLLVFLNNFKWSVEVSLLVTTCFLVVGGFLISNYWVFKRNE